MAKTTLNQADFSGSYGTEAAAITFASNQVTTTIVSGLTATLSADKTYWHFEHVHRAIPLHIGLGENCLH